MERSRFDLLSSEGTQDVRFGGREDRGMPFPWSIISLVAGASECRTSSLFSNEN